MKLPTTLLALALLSAPALAQRAPSPVRPPAQDPERKTASVPPAPGTTRVIERPASQAAPALGAPKGTADAREASSRIPRDRLYFATQADGSPQVRGQSYKAEFSPGGATFIPDCGPSAPENHPLSLRIESLRAGGTQVAFEPSVAAVRDGTTVRYARGSLTEVYELGLDSIEQSFVLEALPGSGELVLRLACASAMQAQSESGAIVFHSADGSVRYGAATAIDANGAQQAASTELVDGGIEIRVPAEFLATAAFPLTIDPVIATFNVNWGVAYDDFAPAIAWDESTQRYCTVMEEVFSAADHDVIYVFSDPAGTFLSAGYINIGAEYWANPDVANNNMVNQFFVAAEVGSPSGGARTIHGMTLDASTSVLGPNVDISTSGFGEQINPSVGGDPYLGASYYTIVWQRIYSPGVDDDIHCRLIDTNSVLAGTGTFAIDNSGGTLDRHPRISKSCQQYGLHHVVWERWLPGGYCDVYAAELDWAGVIMLPSTAIIVGGVTSAPACSPIDNLGNWMLVCQSGAGPDRDIYGAHLYGLTVHTPFNMSWDESFLGTGNLTRDQIHPAVDTDGVHFAVSYSEQFGASTVDYDTYVTTVDYIGTLVKVGEFHQLLAASINHEDFPRMCSQQASGGSGNRLGIAWSDDVGAPYLRDVEAGVYATGDFTKLCTAGWAGVISCPCSNPETAMGRGCNNSSATGGASLEGSGNASIGGDTAQLSTNGEKPTATSIVMQGPTQLPAGVAFGQGVRCVGGALKRLYTKTAAGGAILAPGAGDPSIHARSAALGDALSAGSVRYYLVYYRDPTVLGGCSAASTFNATDALQIVWRP